MDYYIDFQGYCRLKADSVDEVREKFYDSFYGNGLQDLNLEINCIEEAEEEQRERVFVTRQGAGATSEF